MVAGTVLGVFIFFAVMASVFLVFTNVLDALNGSGFRNPRAPKEETMADQEWTVKELIEALKRFPVDAKVYYDMGPNGPETIGKAQYAKTWGDSKEMGFCWANRPGANGETSIYFGRI